MLILVGAVSTATMLNSGSASASSPGIIGGEPQSSGNFSFARVIVAGAFDCSGTVVSDGWVVTAGHCADTGSKKAYQVQLWQGAIGQSTGWTSAVDDLIRDPNFAVVGTVVIHDALLLHTSSAMPAWAVAIPLVNSSTALNAGVGVTAFGWGRTGINSPASTMLQKSPDGTLSIGPCPQGHNQGQLCLNENANELWHGDSGGPILVWQAGAWQLVGLISQSLRTKLASAWPLSPSQSVDRSWVQSTIGVPNLSNGSIIRDEASGVAWLVMADGYRHWIPTSGDYQCFQALGSQVYSYPLRVVETIPEAVGSQATCTPPTTYTEQEGHHGVNTFTDYHNASGQGPSIAPGQYVQVSCKIYDPTIASVNPDGYWYRIASSPWNNGYYSPANTFMNGDAWGCWVTSSCVHNTDWAVPNC
jgi:hypothetical protein